MKKIALLLIVIATSIVSYLLMSDFSSSEAICIVVNTSDTKESLTIPRTDVKSIFLERMPYSTPKHQQFQIVVDVSPGAKKMLYEFTSKNIGKNASIYFRRQLFSNDIAIGAAVEDIRLSTLNIDVDKTLGIFNKITNNVQYKK